MPFVLWDEFGEKTLLDESEIILIEAAMVNTYGIKSLNTCKTTVIQKD